MVKPISVAIPIASKVNLTGLSDKSWGQFFKCRQQQMRNWLTMKRLLIVIQVTRPKPTDTNLRIAEIAQWIERNRIGLEAILRACRIHSLTSPDSNTTKSLWDELDRKYNTEELGLEKYIAEQTHEMINLQHALADAVMMLLEKFLVMSIMDKFPQS
ncbi:UNVERIFIED_CONTAM: hypothetical protein Sindi_2679600 [Sesamum indicum]